MKNVAVTAGTGIIAAIVLSLFLINLLSGIASGIWLAILGEWALLLGGIVATILMPWVFAIATMPSLGIFALIFGRENPPNRLVAALVGFVASIWESSLIGLWVFNIFYSFFMEHSDEVTTVPLLLWGYSTTMAPLAHMARAEDRESKGTSLGLLLAVVVYGLLTALFFLDSTVESMLVCVGITVVAKSTVATALLVAASPLREVRASHDSLESSVAVNREKDSFGDNGDEIGLYQDDEVDDAELRNLKQELASAKRDLAVLKKPDTIFAFGQMAYDGDGVPQDYVEAVGWFRIAAERGHVGAAHNLGLMCEEGKGVPRDSAEAAKWYRKAAEQGHAGSQNNLALLFEKGEGVLKDEGQALLWYQKAAENGDANAAANAARIQSKMKRDGYNAMIGEFVDSISTDGPPLIGDCAMLPHPKQELLYALRWLIVDYETTLDATSDDNLRSKCESLLPTLYDLFTRLARDWHEINPEDKESVARLRVCESFPDWASSLRARYINEDRARNEALDVAIQVSKDRVGLREAIG